MDSQPIVLLPLNGVRKLSAGTQSTLLSDLYSCLLIKIGSRGYSTTNLNFCMKGYGVLKMVENPCIRARA